MHDCYLAFLSRTWEYWHYICHFYINTTSGQYSLEKPSAPPVSQKLVLAFAKKIYTLHVYQAILNSRTIDFFVTLHLLNFFCTRGQPARII